MKQKLFVCAVTSAIFGIVSTAQANWQYTKWGMTPEQVIEASEGNVSIVQDTSDSSSALKCTVGGTYRSGS